MAAVETSVAGRIARLKLSAPPLNILTTALQIEMLEALQGLHKRRDYNAVFIHSGVSGVFSAGADVAEHRGRGNVAAMLKAAHALIAELLRSPVPTLCFVEGPCLGGAFEMALACDQIVAAEKATFGTPEIQLGCYPPAALALMPWKLPSLLASELIQGGHGISAAEFAQRGGARVADAGIQAAMEQAAHNYANLPRGPLIETTRLLRPGAAERFLAQVGGIESDYLERLLSLHDAEEGPEAFLAKRKPAWNHTESG
ncbi:MAG: enoyl-CoA hydratase/isomerase family protein [Planctomycetes bacterium]|nr:enoyl-CoA hydratase/isomerase family protein [Planctomycetota bacterium]MCB9934960.1 enoyl-CoA hydratase/isomerase family protein [Planctomycetota bacterium]